MPSTGRLASRRRPVNGPQRKRVSKYFRGGPHVVWPTLWAPLSVATPCALASSGHGLAQRLLELRNSTALRGSCFFFKETVMTRQDKAPVWRIRRPPVPDRGRLTALSAKMQRSISQRDS